MYDPQSALSLVQLLSASPRPPGSSGSVMARRAIEGQLAALGYTVRPSKTEVTDWASLQNPSIDVLGENARSISGLPAILSVPTPPEGVMGTVGPAESIKMLDTYPWVRLGVFEPDAGTAIAFLLSCDGDLRIQPLPNSAETVPHVIIDFPTFSELASQSRAVNGLHVRVYNPCLIRGSCELISLITSEYSDQSRIFICAHLDSTFNAPGALDNATGVAVALQLALIARERGWACQFGFFDGEELNKAGSTHYVESLTETDLKKISYVFEIDTVGAGREIAFLCSKKISKFLRSAVYPELPEGFSINICPQSRISFSDVWPFMQRGVRVIRMLTRGHTRGEGNDLIHTVADSVDKVDSSTLQTSMYAATVLAEHLSHRVASDN